MAVLMRAYRIPVFAALLVVSLVSGAAAQDPVTNVRWYRVDDSRLVMYYDLVAAAPCPI